MTCILYGLKATAHRFTVGAAHISDIYSGVDRKIRCPCDRFNIILHLFLPQLSTKCIVKFAVIFKNNLILQ